MTEANDENMSLKQSQIGDFVSRLNALFGAAAVSDPQALERLIDEIAEAGADAREEDRLIAEAIDPQPLPDTRF